MKGFFLFNLQIPPPSDGGLFEKICLELYKAEYGEQTQINGRQGQSQDGVDIFVQDQDIGIQCKKREVTSKIKKEELLKEVEKAKNFDPSLKKFILATTCKRDANIQKEARIISEKHRNQDLFSVEIHSWDEIKDLFEKHPTIYQKFYGIDKFIKKSKYNAVQYNLNSELDLNLIKSNSSHSELNRIKDLIDNKPQTAFKQLEKLKAEEWHILDDKEKYRVITNMGCAKIKMNENMEGCKLLIGALQFNKEDEDANYNCAMGYLIRNDIEKAKQYIEKVKELNPLNINAYIINVQIQDREDKTLEEIIDSIPADLKENDRMIHALAHISIRKKQYEQAEKWLKLSCKNKDHIVESEYAEMSLQIILEKYKVFTSRCAPDSVIPELEKIIDIYKKLTTNRDFDELKKFHPYWYIHYAISLEINGQIDKAIQVINKGIDIFPENKDLKIELCRFLEVIGKIEESIIILEKIKEKTFEMNLKLADLYFFTDNKEKGKKLLRKIIIDESISQDNRIEAKRYLIFRLINFGDFNEAEKILDAFFEDDRGNILTLILKSKIESHKKNIEQKNNYLKEAISLSKKNNVHIRDIQQLVLELYFSKMYRMCESLLEKITENNMNHPEKFKLLHVYFENGKNEKAIELAKQLFKKFPNRIEPIDVLFHVHETLGNRKKAINYCKQFIHLNPDNSIIKLQLIFAYIREQKVIEAKKLLDSITNLEQLSVKQINYLSIAYIHIRDFKKALKIQYQNIKNHPSSLEAQRLYFELVTVYGQIKEQNSILFQSDKVDLDYYVKIKEINNQTEREIIIEESADIFTPGHELSKKLLGKKKGDVIDIGNEKYKIVDIKSKYIYKYQDIPSNMNINFPSNNFMKSISITKNATAKDILQSMRQFMADSSQIEKRNNQVFQYYKKGEIGIGAISKIINQHPIEVIEYLTRSKKDKFISSQPERDDYNNSLTVLNNYSDLIIDLSSLITLHGIKLEQYLERSNNKFNLYICQSTIDSLENLIQSRKLHAKDGLLMLIPGGENEQPKKSFTSPEKIVENLDFLKKVKQWAKDHCQIKSISDSLIISREKINEMEKLLGKEFCDPLLVVKEEKNIILLCEDEVSRTLAKNDFESLGVRLFDMVRYFENQQIIDVNKSIQFKAELVKLNQTYIPIDHKILMFLLKEGQYGVNHFGFQRGLFFLGPVSNLQSIICVTSDFFIDLFQNSPILLSSQEVIVKETLNQLSFGRSENPKKIADSLIQLVKSKTALLPIHQDEICQCIQNWLNTKIY